MSKRISKPTNKRYSYNPSISKQKSISRPPTYMPPTQRKSISRPPTYMPPTYMPPTERVYRSPYYNPPLNPPKKHHLMKKVLIFALIIIVIIVVIIIILKTVVHKVEGSLLSISGSGSKKNNGSGPNCKG